MALTSPRVCALAAAALLPGCGTQYSDPIRREPDEGSDVCAVWTTEAECRNDSANGCSFQPNEPGCLTTDPECPPGICRSGDPFVRRAGRTLTLRGAPYRFLGSVSWGIAWGTDCRVSSQPDQETALVRTFDDLVDMRAAVLKVWAFQSYAGEDGRDYASFERVVAAARRAGVRLVFVLENHWQADCTSGPVRNDDWYATGHRSPYGDYALSFSDYARELVAHFRDEPTIMAWEIVHEGRGEDFPAMNEFAQGMTSLVRETDPNHLIVLGVDNGDSPATSRDGAPSNYALLHGLPAVDMMDVHDFFDVDVPLNASMNEIAAIAEQLDKPVFAGATSVALDADSSEALRVRAERVERKIEAALAAGFAGFLVYDYFPDWGNPGSSFDAREGEPLAGPAGVLARHAPSR